MPENNTRKPDKSATVHVSAGTMEKIERYQQFIKDNHPGMPDSRKDKSHAARLNTGTGQR
ncbi:hypothetical protein ACLB1N_04865 [Escherichia coli]